MPAESLEMLTTYVSSEIAQSIRDEAKRTERSVSFVCGLALKAWVENTSKGAKR